MEVLTEQWWQRRLGPLLPAIFLWVLFIVVTSTQIAPAGLELTWQQALRRSVLSWTVWALLTPLIIKVDRWLPLSRDALFKRFAIHVPLSLFFTTVKQLLVGDAMALFLRSGPEQSIDSLGASFKGTFQANVLAYWVVIFLYNTLEYRRHLKEQEIRTAELKRLASQARLEILRAQLHPHFLFNALNTISAHVERSPRTSRYMLEELEGLLRLSLEHSQEQEVPLAQEIAFVKHYLEIQKARFEERLAATVEADPDILQALVPTFILQPIVENAVLYGMSNHLKEGTVEVRAWRDRGQLRMMVQDDGPGLPQGWDPDESVGIGISNTRERLRQLYGDRDQTFDISSEPGKGVRVELSIPFRER
jgi:two-component system, LytTR family, sensor kinase